MHSYGLYHIHMSFSILSAMFTGACGPPEKLSLALVPGCRSAHDCETCLLHNAKLSGIFSTALFVVVETAAHYSCFLYLLCLLRWIIESQKHTVCQDDQDHEDFEISMYLLRTRLGSCACHAV